MRIGRFVVGVALAYVIFFVGSLQAYAVGDLYLNVSPMRENIVLNPGDVYKGSFLISNPGFSEETLRYGVSVEPFYVDEESNPIFKNDTDSGRMVEWLTIDSEEIGEVEPNHSTTIEYTIKVPEDAPAGGQYACIRAATNPGAGDDGNVNIQESFGICHVVLAEVTGNTTHTGEILSANMPSFLLGGNIAGSSVVKNTGNVHALAVYKMKVLNVFGGRVVYTNEEEPESHYVLPDRTYYDETVWAETPMMGIFNVEYVVEFQGLTTTVNRMVIVCPWWLLFIIIAIIMILVIRIMTLIKLQKVEDRSKAQM